MRSPLETVVEAVAHALVASDCMKRRLQRQQRRHGEIHLPVTGCVEPFQKIYREFIQIEEYQKPGRVLCVSLSRAVVGGRTSSR